MYAPPESDTGFFAGSVISFRIGKGSPLLVFSVRSSKWILLSDGMFFIICAGAYKDKVG